MTFSSAVATHDNVNLTLCHSISRNLHISSDNADYHSQQFEISNYYPNAEEGRVSLEEYINSEKYTLYACTQVFVSEASVADKTAYMEEVLDKLSVQGMARQYVYFYFTDKPVDFLEQEYLENYDDLVMHFKNADYLTGYESYLIKKGIIQK